MYLIYHICKFSVNKSNCKSFYYKLNHVLNISLFFLCIIRFYKVLNESDTLYQ